MGVVECLGAVLISSLWSPLLLLLLLLLCCVVCHACRARRPMGECDLTWLLLDRPHSEAYALQRIVRATQCRCCNDCLLHSKDMVYPVQRVMRHCMSGGKPETSK